jgi:hypothetical protein
MPSVYLPVGSLIYFDTSTNSTPTWQKVSEHNRAPARIDTLRIEKSQRMANGLLRKYFIDDKKTLSVSWNMLPSKSDLTVDGGWGAVDIQDYYGSATKGQGAFKVKIVYGKQISGGSQVDRSEEFVAVFTQCSFTVVKRNVKGKNSDPAQEFWAVSLTLDEV